MQTLTQDQVDAFNEQGFLRLEKVFDTDAVARQSEELERLMQEWATHGPGWKGPWRQAYMTAEEDTARAPGCLGRPPLIFRGILPCRHR